MDSSCKVFRILDAATNRGREAIRVIEDLIRFICDDCSLMTLLKNFRHDFAILTKEIPQTERMIYRDTELDVGITVQGKGEYCRSSLIELATANFCRLQESLRSLEEFSKMILPQISTELEQLRYRSYILEKKTFSRMIEYRETEMDNLSIERKTEELKSKSIDYGCKKERGNHFFQEKNEFQCSLLFNPKRAERIRRLFFSSLYVLIDAQCSDEQFLELVSSGVDLVQLRDKSATDREIVKRGRELRNLISCFFDDIKIKNQNEEKLKASYQTNQNEEMTFRQNKKTKMQLPPLLIMNDRPDLAVLAHFDGVHLGQEELSVDDARKIIGSDLLVGLSTHSLDQAKAAFLADVDYIGAGPIFPSKTKNFETFPGLSFLKDLVALRWFESKMDGFNGSRLTEYESDKKELDETKSEKCELSQKRCEQLTSVSAICSSKSDLPINNSGFSIDSNRKEKENSLTEVRFQTAFSRFKPVFAIGGISLDNLESVLKSGICRVAVSSAIIKSNNINEAVAKFKEKLETKVS
ncbi:MAG: thiamine phosphate synthase [Planctomycetia bacterium]|nr:thiamine phosphate synthase [Planctomycetia bacterium]